MNIVKPPQYWTWPKAAQDSYDEREAIMREANSIDDRLPAPIFIQQTATKEAEFHLQKT
jgi:hypothetical protein